MEISNEKYKQYFLETLSAAEAREIELQIIADEDFAAEIDSAETDLLEDYLEGLLSAEEKNLFEKNYLITNKRQQNLELLKSLKQFGKKPPTKIKLPEQNPSFFESLKSFFTLRGVVLVAGLLALVIALGVVWRVFSPASAVDSEIASVNLRDLSNLDEFKNLTNLNLISESLRSANDRSNLETKNLSQNVFFRLALPPNTPLNSTFQVKLRQNQTEVFTLNQVKIYDNRPGQELRLIIPAALLKKGNYQIELETPNQAKIFYNFAVN